MQIAPIFKLILLMLLCRIRGTGREQSRKERRRVRQAVYLPDEGNGPREADGAGSPDAAAPLRRHHRTGEISGRDGYVRGEEGSAVALTLHVLSI